MINNSNTVSRSSITANGSVKLPVMMSVHNPRSRSKTPIRNSKRVKYAVARTSHRMATVDGSVNRNRSVSVLTVVNYRPS